MGVTAYDVAPWWRGSGTAAGQGSAGLRGARTTFFNPDPAAQAMLVGAHVTARGGVSNAPDRAEEIGCESVQIFAKNQRQWSAPPYEEAEVEGWHEAMKRTGIAAACTHASYLINLCQDDDAGLEKARDALVDELQRAERLGIPHVVVHPGAHKDHGVDWGLDRIADSVEACVDRADAPSATPLLEPAAGEGSKIPHTLEQLAGILDRLSDPDAAAVCLDTCHSFAAGYDLSTAEGYEAFVEELDDRIGVDRVEVWHLNDSQHPLGSNKDRHANLGDGEIGTGCFERLVDDDRWTDVPGILETPIDDYPDYAEEIALLKGFRS